MKRNRTCTELSTCLRQVFHIRNSWIFLPGLCALLLVYGTHYSNVVPWITGRNFNEKFAPWLVLTVFAVLLPKSILSRNPLAVFLAALACIFYIRELNDTVFSLFGAAYHFKSKKLVDCLLVGMALWAYLWRGKLVECLNRSPQLTVMLSGVLWTYLFSQLVARRIFKGVFPDEQLLHIALEETVETAAHLFFLWYAFFCCFRISNRRTGQDRATTGITEPRGNDRPAQSAGPCKS